MVPDCASEPLGDGLCHRHEWRWRGRKDMTLQQFIAVAEPLSRRADCKVAGCTRESVGAHGLCRIHRLRLRREHNLASLSDQQFTAWVAAQQPRLPVGQFSLAGLDAPLVTEVLYGLQQRDAFPPPLNPTVIRVLAEHLPGTTSLRDADPQVVCRTGNGGDNRATRTLLNDLRRHVDRAWAAYHGQDPFSGDTWRVALLDLQPNPSRPWPATHGVIDFTPIQVDWLRAVTKGWAKTTRPHLQILRQTIQAVEIASQVLVATGRTDPVRLGASDYTRVVDAITTGRRRRDGNLYSAAFRNLMLHQLRTVLEHGRATGMMTMVPDPFRSPVRRHRVRDDPNEDALGRAIPESVITQLDANLHRLGTAGRFGAFTAEDLTVMHQTIYQILRDTGRRPGEIVSLGIDCLEIVDGAHNLIYDNHKAGRRARRLPIGTATATIITDWRARRRRIQTAPLLDRWLFPSPLLRSQHGAGHLTSSAVTRAFKEWAEAIPVIHSETIGPDGTPEPFDRSRIRPYALRHSYAQRHADAGVQVDVLKDLMDHVAVATTMGYYQVSNKRKRAAIGLVGAHAITAAGDPAPFTSPTAYQRSSVSVPYGNCTEPSNVTAGGGACPIRFQCAGCGFYRPDPSYLPALGQHIADLRRDRETARAMGAAEYVTTNLTAQIDAFTAVTERMREQLARLPAAERADVEDAANLLRKTRAARQLPITPTRHGRNP